MTSAFLVRRPGRRQGGCSGCLTRVCAWEKESTQRPRGKEITPSTVPYLRAGIVRGIQELRGIEGREGETKRKYVAHAGSVSSLCACGELQPTHPRALSTCVDCFDFVPSTCPFMCLPVSRLFWVSSLAYPNLLGTKGYVVVVVVVTPVCGAQL
jgi:hypothetical protein